MSRKLRPRNKPELVETGPGQELPAEGRDIVYPLTGKLHDTLEAIISGCAISAKTAALPPLLEAGSALIHNDEAADLVDELSRKTLEDENEDFVDDDNLYDDELADVDIDAGIADLTEAFGGITLTTRVLARALLARVLDRQPTQPGVSLIAGPADVEREGDDAVVDRLTQQLLPQNVPQPLRPSRADRRDAFAEAASLIREVGLEEFDMSCDVGTSPDGTPELFASALSPESAHVALLEFLFWRAESVAAELDPLLAAERDASEWEFSRWNAAPPPGSGSIRVGTFAGSIREQEYSLADRQTITLGRSVMSDLAQDDGFAELFPRQYRLAAALTTSFVDVFECVALEGRRATLRSTRDGRTYDVHEHVEPIGYAPGSMAAGRLLPFEDELYLRSPGMIFFDIGDPSLMKTTVDMVADAAAALPPALALEAFISSVVLQVRVPRAVKPARSRADARELLSMIEEVLMDPETEPEPAPMPSAVYYVPSHHDEESVVNEGVVQLDSTLESFMAALAEQAAAGERHERKRRVPPKKKKGKRRR